MNSNSILSNINTLLSDYKNNVSERMIFDILGNTVASTGERITEEYHDNLDFYKEENISLKDYYNMEYDSVFEEILESTFDKITDDVCWSIVYTARYSSNIKLKNALDNIDLDTTDFMFGSSHGVNSLNEFMRKLAMNIIINLAHKE
ncbi:MAG TPA: hypothetical protein PK507_05105 [bacterium]|nr:hypothetical protein [bacterium]